MLLSHISSLITASSSRSSKHQAHLESMTPSRNGFQPPLHSLSPTRLALGYPLCLQFLWLLASLWAMSRRGLGKTAQSIAVLEYQRQLCHMPGPFLVVAPLTTLGHWQREIQTWTPMVRSALRSCLCLQRSPLGDSSPVDESAAAVRRYVDKGAAGVLFQLRSGFICLS